MLGCWMQRYLKPLRTVAEAVIMGARKLVLSLA